MMRAEIKRGRDAVELVTPERCHIKEIANDEGDELVSVAHARVEAGITTAWHKLNGVTERYIIISGQGRAQIGDHPPIEVAAGDVVRIPAGTRQRIENTGLKDLVFYAVCSPPFQPNSYVSLE